MPQHVTMNSQLLLVLAAAALLAITLVHPLYPQEQWLQHPPTVLCLIALAVAARKRWLTTPRWRAWSRCSCSTSSAHAGSTRTSPTREWCDAVFGAGPQEWFGWTRNHYDRLVHLAFGLLMPLPIVEAATRYGGLSRRWALFTAISAVASASAVYEVFEWLLAIVAAPEFAEHYNGQQGDIWDGQKDMALAIAGSLIATMPLAFRRNPLAARR